MKINIKKVIPEALTPVYSSDGANCFDFFTPFDGAVGSFGTAEVNTGVAFEIPEGFCLLLFSRSGHGFKNDIRLSNCVGVIDSDFTGAIKVKLRNDSAAPFEFKAGDRIAQGMLIYAPKVDLNEVGYFMKKTARGNNGFGSTGN